MTSDSATDLPVSFRNVTAAVATPVCVITALSGRGPHGRTVGAFAALSRNPPMVVESLAQPTDGPPLTYHCRVFGTHAALTPST